MSGTSHPDPHRSAVRALSFHADYACRHSGACCTAGWPIPVEADRLLALRRAIADRRVAPAAPGDALTFPPDAPSATPAILGLDRHTCVFFDERREGHCRIHAALGHEALPLACRQFPRVTVVDPRGVSVTLSHYCPTARAMLDDGAPIRIVGDAPAFPPTAEFVGLDVRAGLPPLLRPNLLMDWDAWWAFEAQAVACLADESQPPVNVLARLGDAVEFARAWTPARGALAARVDGAFRRRGPFTPARFDAERLVDEACEAIPAGLSRPLLRRADQASDRVVRRFLASHAFANWTAHLGQGLRTWLRSIETAYAFVALGIGPAQADLILRHLADGQALTAVWARAER